MRDIFNSSDDSKRKKKKKKKKKSKSKKYEKTLNHLLGKGKKAKKSVKSKSRKRAGWELKLRLIEKAADTSFGTYSDIVKMFAESRFFPNGRGNRTR